MEKTAEQMLQEAKQQISAGELFQAVATLTQTVMAYPDCADAYLERGRLLLSMGDKAGATKDMIEVARLRPEMITGHFSNQK